MQVVKRAAAALLLLLAPSILRAEYKIVLRGGTTYWTRTKPAERHGAYVFTATDGTLLSVRKSEVATLGVAEAPRVEATMEEPGEISPVDAVRHQRALEESLRKRPKNAPQPTDAYRAGVGVPYMPGQNDYVVGKTYAAPAGSTVYSGSAPTDVPAGEVPTGVRSGDAPQGAPSVNATNGSVAPPPSAPTDTTPPTEAPPPTETAPPTPTAQPTAPPPPAGEEPSAAEEPPPPPAR
jgi:hypothetical protein